MAKRHFEEDPNASESPRSIKKLTFLSEGLRGGRPEPKAGAGAGAAARVLAITGVAAMAVMTTRAAMRALDFMACHS